MSVTQIASNSMNTTSKSPEKPKPIDVMVNIPSNSIPSTTPGINQSGSGFTIQVNTNSTLGSPSNNNDESLELLMLKRWFCETIEMPQYFNMFIENGYDTLFIIREITEKAELKEIGIKTFKDQTIMMSEIRKLKDVDLTAGIYTEGMRAMSVTNNN